MHTTSSRSVLLMLRTICHRQGSVANTGVTLYTGRTQGISVSYLWSSMGLPDKSRGTLQRCVSTDKITETDNWGPDCYQHGHQTTTQESREVRYILPTAEASSTSFGHHRCFSSKQEQRLRYRRSCYRLTRRSPTKTRVRQTGLLTRKFGTLDLWTYTCAGGYFYQIQKSFTQHLTC